MNLQYVFDKNSVTTGVIIPIHEWDALQAKYAELEKDEQNFIDIPEWHKGIIEERLVYMKNNPDDLLDFDKVCHEIDKEL